MKRVEGGGGLCGQGSQWQQLVGDCVARAANGNSIRVHPKESGKGGKTISTNMITTTN